MSNSVRRSSKSRQVLNVEVEIGGRPCCLSACWNDGRVEVTDPLGRQTIYAVAELVVQAPHLLKALSVMVQGCCSPAHAAAHIRAMNKALQKQEYTGTCVKNKRMKYRSEAKEANAQKLSRAAADPLYGLCRIGHQVGGVCLEGVSVDGHFWLISGHRGTFEELARTAPAPLLAELLLAAGPFLQNPGGFYKAIAAASPELSAFPAFAPYVQPHKKVVFRTQHPGFEWVIDALKAQREGSGAPLRPHTRPLHNRARHVH